MEKSINGIKLLHLEEADSTNRIALELCGAEHLFTVVADRQSGGMGRLGRSFFSPDGGLYMSVVLDPAKVICGVPVCTAAALAVKDALEARGISGLAVKWVNDILMNGRKVCGILTKARSCGEGINAVVVGIGVNLREPLGGFPDDIKDRAASVGYSGDRLLLAADIAARLGDYAATEKSRLLPLYRNSLALVGCESEVTDFSLGSEKIKGTVLGVDDECRLIFRGTDGRERVIISGEII